MVNIPDAAIGAVVAALIAGTISLLGLIISKEQKTSEFRQAWIDALRSDLTALLTQINAIHDATKVKYPNHAEKVAALRPLYIPLNTSTFNILLRINPNESKCKRLLGAMEAFNALTADETKLTTENIRIIEKEFLESSQALLKSEWRRVKAGEWTFRVAKLLALIVILASVVIGIFAAYKSHRPESNNSSKPKLSRLDTPASQDAAQNGVMATSYTAKGTK
ncbi:hypothetical protein YH63_016970 [Afipia massiliensis]|uniref:Uncharacterized protein n=1 Tax=Afipia massiliensis TaxID=211460 RepID=A0A4U6BR26_9BRAD|nr:hypothetical protein [Afipia massiliensis]TKT72977.1 hypothetical protein YH63_016970 [Afipia massiliensis]